MEEGSRSLELHQSLSAGKTHLEFERKGSGAKYRGILGLGLSISFQQDDVCKHQNSFFFLGNLKKKLCLFHVYENIYVNIHVCVLYIKCQHEAFSPACKWSEGAESDAAERSNTNNSLGLLQLYPVGKGRCFQSCVAANRQAACDL